MWSSQWPCPVPWASPLYDGHLRPLPDGRGSVYLVPLNMVPAPLPDEELTAPLDRPLPSPPASSPTAAGPLARTEVIILSRFSRAAASSGACGWFTTQ